MKFVFIRSPNTSFCVRKRAGSRPHRAVCLAVGMRIYGFKMGIHHWDPGNHSWTGWVSINLPGVFRVPGDDPSGPRVVREGRGTSPLGSVKPKPRCCVRGGIGSRMQSIEVDRQSHPSSDVSRGSKACWDRRGKRKAEYEMDGLRKEALALGSHSWRRVRRDLVAHDEHSH